MRKPQAPNLAGRRLRLSIHKSNMGHTIPRDNRQDKILSLIDDLFVMEIAPAQAADGLMTLQEAAKFLHVSEQTVHAWRKRGIIEGLQYGEEWRFERGELIKAGRKTQASKKPLRMVS